MPTATFYHKTFPERPGTPGVASPCPHASGYLVAVHAEVDGRVLISDQEGDEHPIGAGEGNTHRDRARPGTIGLLRHIAAARGIELSPDDISERDAPGA